MSIGLYNRSAYTYTSHDDTVDDDDDGPTGLIIWVLVYAAGVIFLVYAYVCGYPRYLEHKERQGQGQTEAISIHGTRSKGTQPQKEEEGDFPPVASQGQGGAAVAASGQGSGPDSGPTLVEQLAV